MPVVMLGHQTPGGPSSDARTRTRDCAHCPDGCDNATIGKASMYWEPPENPADLPPWSWLSPRPRRVETDAGPYLRVIHDHHRQIATAPVVPYVRVRYGSR